MSKNQNSDVAWCQHCTQTLLLEFFDLKKNGTRKAFCRLCCSRLSGKNKNRKPQDVENYLGQSYEVRRVALLSIGFSSYQEYLNSDLWKRVREKVFKKSGRKCFLCGEFATQVHHNRYKIADLLGKKLKHLAPICGRCHHEIEFVNERKCSVAHAANRFDSKQADFHKQKKIREVLNDGTCDRGDNAQYAQ